jgi:uncharacterized membrane protein
MATLIDKRISQTWIVQTAIGRVTSFLGSLTPKQSVGLIILFHLAIAIPLAAFLNIYIDEAYSLNTSGQDLRYALQQAINFELQPPAYFVLLNLWIRINNSIFFARLFSMVCTVALIFVTYKISNKILKGIAPIWLMAAVALNPFIIWAAIEIRAFAFVILISALLLDSFTDGYLADVPKKRARVYYVVWAILALYTQYYLGLLLVANALTLFAWRRWRTLFSYCTDMAIATISFIPMIHIMVHKVSAISTEISRGSILNGLLTAVNNASYYIFPFSKPELAHFRVFLTCLLISLCIFCVIRYRQVIGKNFINYGIILIALFLLFAYMGYVAGSDSISLRHTAILFMPTMLFIFSLLQILSEKRKYLKLLTVWTLFVLLLYSSSLLNSAKNLSKPGDWQRVATYIMSHEKINQPILLFPSEVAISFSHHYSGLNPLVPLPKAEDFRAYDMREFVLGSEEEISGAITSLKTNPNGVWVVTDFISNNSEPTHCGHLGVKYNCNILENFVSKNYDVTLEKSFNGSKARLLTKHPISDKEPSTL